MPPWAPVHGKCTWLINSCPSPVVRRPRRWECHRQCLFQLGTLVTSMNHGSPSPASQPLGCVSPDLLTFSPRCLQLGLVYSQVFCFFNTVKRRSIYRSDLKTVWTSLLTAVKNRNCPHLTLQISVHHFFIIHGAGCPEKSLGTGHRRAGF